MADSLIPVEYEIPIIEPSKQALEDARMLSELLIGIERQVQEICAIDRLPVQTGVLIRWKN